MASLVAPGELSTSAGRGSQPYRHTLSVGPLQRSNWSCCLVVVRRDGTELIAAHAVEEAVPCCTLQRVRVPPG